MISNSIFIPLNSFLGGTGGAGGTPPDLVRAGGTRGRDRWDRRAQDRPRGLAIFHGGPTGPTHQSHQKPAELLAVPPVPPVPPA